MSNWPPIDLYLIFEKSSLKNQVGRSWFFCLFRTWILQATQAVKIKFEIDKKSSSSNLIFQTLFVPKIMCRSIGGLSHLFRRPCYAHNRLPYRFFPHPAQRCSAWNLFFIWLKCNERQSILDFVWLILWQAFNLFKNGLK